jgi:ABC-type multidrug transport system ATPase subunit
VRLQVEFLPRCDKVAIMDEGNCVYFGPWNEGAQKLLSRWVSDSPGSARKQA